MPSRIFVTLAEAKQSTEHIKAAGFVTATRLYRPITTDGDTCFGDFWVEEWIPCGENWGVNAVIICDGEKVTVVGAESITVEV